MQNFSWTTVEDSNDMLSSSLVDLHKQTPWGEKCRKRPNVGDKKLVAKGLIETTAIYKSF